MRATADGLVRQLANAGYKTTAFSVETIGNWAVADADWNYKDVPHLNIVHTKVRAILGTIDEDVITTINLQKVLGIPVPLVLVNFATSERSQSYFTAFGPFLLIVHTEYFELGPNRTKVVTTYNLAAASLWSLAFPILRRILVSNYRTLMSEDVPMRDRRGALRASGFRFASDGRSRTFTETTDLTITNVVAPALTGRDVIEIPLAELAENGTERFVGRDDDTGVRLVVKEGLIHVFPRTCDHEGASLDCAKVANDRIACPWHAKVFRALGSLEPREGGALESGPIRLEVGGGVLRAYVRQPVSIG
jgi:nitrite reductase/ring-hydroxylating ferredoxin subunit